MDIKALKEQIKSLDPKAHKALLDALTAEYNRLAGKEREGKPQTEEAPDPFDEMLKKAEDELERRYIKGTYAYIQKHYPGLHQKMNKAQDRLYEVKKAGKEGRANIEEFRKALEEWYLLFLKGIEIYSKEKGQAGEVRHYGFST